MSDKLSGHKERGLSGAVVAVVPEAAGGIFSLGVGRAAVGVFPTAATLANWVNQEDYA